MHRSPRWTEPRAGPGYGGRIGWGIVRVVVAAGLVAGLSARSPGASPPAAATPVDVVPGDGKATHYDSVDGGNCSLPSAPADHLDVALSHVEYGTADACGGYLDVVGPEGSVRVLITNQCPECPVGHIDLSRPAFDRVGRLEAGEIPVSYSLVRNPPVAQPIAVRVKTGSSRWWMQIQALDHGNPISAFELRTGDGWRSLVHTDDNFWMAENPGPGDGPYTVRITDIYGQSVTVDGIAMAPDQVQRTGARLYPAGGAGAAPPPPGPSPTDAPAPPPSAPTTTAAPPTTVAVPKLSAVARPPAGAAGRSPATDAVAAQDGEDRGRGPGRGAAALTAAVLALAAARALAARRRRRSAGVD